VFAGRGFLFSGLTNNIVQALVDNGDTAHKFWWENFIAKGIHVIVAAFPFTLFISSLIKGSSYEN
jgi:hypothetical protein